LIIKKKKILERLLINIIVTLLSQKCQIKKRQLKMTSTMINFCISAFLYLQKQRMWIVLTAYPELICSRIIKVGHGGLSAE